MDEQDRGPRMRATTSAAEPKGRRLSSGDIAKALHDVSIILAHGHGMRVHPSLLASALGRFSRTLMAAGILQEDDDGDTEV